MGLNPTETDTDDMSVTRLGKTRQSRRENADGGAIVAGWLIKLTVALVVVFVVAFDAIAITYNNVSTSDAARSVARAAADAKYLKKSTNAEAVGAAEQRADSVGVTLDPENLIFQPDGSVEVTVSSSVDTIVAKYIPPLEELTTAVETYISPPLLN